MNFILKKSPEKSGGNILFLESTNLLEEVLIKERELSIDVLEDIDDTIACNGLIQKLLDLL